MTRPHNSQGIRIRTIAMMKSDVTIPAAADRITAANIPATVNLRSTNIRRG